MGRGWEGELRGGERGSEHGPDPSVSQSKKISTQRLLIGEEMSSVI